MTKKMSRNQYFFIWFIQIFCCSSIFARRRTMSGMADRFDGGDGSVGTASGDVPPIADDNNGKKCLPRGV
jgi:hypothetical protein